MQTYTLTEAEKDLKEINKNKNNQKIDEKEIEAYYNYMRSD